MDARTALARRVAIGSLLALLLALLFATAAAAPLPTRVVLAAFATMPLVVFLPGMLRGQWKTFQWLCFVVLLYFMQVVLRLFGPQATLLHWLELLLVCTVFISSMLYARWRRGAAGDAETGDATDGN